jgi:hypothetical protein
MYVVKNTFGVSTVIKPSHANPQQIDELGGSCINRKKIDKAVEPEIENHLGIKKIKKIKYKVIKLRTMSRRTRSKIRSKLIAFSQVHEKLTFLTLTFVNQVEDQKAVKVLKSFLDNAGKRLNDFQYIWVAEKQTNNETFKDNIHFHLITNKYWALQKWWNYWLEVQAKHGIKPRDENFRPGSAFNVRLIKTDNVKGIGSYVTKYVTKNTSEFGCQVWNCSKKISRLYTCFYSGIQIIRRFERLQELGLLDGEIKTYHQEFCNVNIIPLNKLVMRFYDPIARRNKERWNDLDEKEGSDV